MYAQTRAQRGLILGALRCALIVGHSAGSVWERVAMATHSFAFTLFTRAICCQVAGVTSPCLANVSIKSTRACLKAGLFMYGALVDTMGVVGWGEQGDTKKNQQKHVVDIFGCFECE